jgi:hypothetical protein
MPFPRYNLARKSRVTIMLDDAERQMLVEIMKANRASISNVLRAALRAYHERQPTKQQSPER